VNALRDMPISRKIMWVILLMTTLALLLAGGGLFGYQLYSFRKNFPREVAGLGEIMASQCAGSLALKDPDGARVLLRALKAKPYITEAQIRLPRGVLFARYGQQTDWTPPAADGVSIDGDYLVYAERVVLQGEHLGTVYLRTAYRSEMLNLVQLYGVVLGFVLTLSILLTALISGRLQGFISEPILRLAATAKAVADRRDYSVRVPKLGNDEIGAFTEAFNDMLQQIQSRDADLIKSRRKFETLVNSIEGVVWEADPETFQFTFVSRQAERLLGHKIQSWTAEPDFWLQHVAPEDRARVLEASRQAVAERTECAAEYRMLAVDGTVLWVRSHFHTIVEDGRLALIRGVLFDITPEKKAAEQLAALHKELLETSRQAGMAEVATGVLHNVGNVLNSVNVSSTLVCERLRKSEVKTVTMLADLLRQHEHDLPDFLTSDPKGRAVPGFIQQLATELEREREESRQELERIAKNIEHIKEIVAMQQSYARVAGVTENLSPVELIEDALQLDAAGLARHGVHVSREYGEVPPVTVDRHKVLQILINLFRNARQSLDESRPERKQLVIGIARNGHNTVKISVTDNGTGISSENLTRIFSLGFTTRRDGHGFGLHSGSLAAREMGGSLLAQSDGPGRGATFILELPIAS
jgi:PAS domain S-box-containing protein